MRIAFVGLGSMGGPMSRNLARAGFDVTVHDLDPGTVARAVEAGALPASTAAEAASACDLLITMLPTPAVIEDVMLAGGQVAAAMTPGSLWVDMSSSVPAVADRVRAQHGARGIRVIDAPVSGMAKGAADATLQIFVGGDADDVARARPVLAALGDPERTFHVGGPGTGYAVKLLLNLLWFHQLVSLAEVLTVGVRAGVDLGVLRSALVASPANCTLLERDLHGLFTAGDYDEGFAMALACKDLRLAVDLARAVDVPVELSAHLEQIFHRARAAYGETAGEMSPVRLYEQLAGITLRLPA